MLFLSEHPGFSHVVFIHTFQIAHSPDHARRRGAAGQSLMAALSFGNSRRALRVVTSRTVSNGNPLILLMYSADTGRFLGSLRTCKQIK